MRNAHWAAEGKPTEGWELHLVDDGQPHWQATIDHTTQRYTLKAARLER